jgi:hypothetical protein
MSGETQFCCRETGSSVGEGEIARAMETQELSFRFT